MKPKITAHLKSLDNDPYSLILTNLSADEVSLLEQNFCELKKIKALCTELIGLNNAAFETDIDYLKKLKTNYQVKLYNFFYYNKVVQLYSRLVPLPPFTFRIIDYACLITAVIILSVILCIPLSSPAVVILSLILTISLLLFQSNASNMPSETVFLSYVSYVKEQLAASVVQLKTKLSLSDREVIHLIEEKIISKKSVCSLVTPSDIDVLPAYPLNSYETPNPTSAFFQESPKYQNSKLTETLAQILSHSQ